MKLYNIGMIIGRFQVLHRGHASMVRHALELCDKVVVYIGSSQEQRTELNPFSYDERVEMFKAVFATEYACKRLILRPLPDIGTGNNDSWGAYVMNTFEKEFHRLPELYITGCEKVRASWFTNNVAPTTDELRLTRNNINVSGTACRETLTTDNYNKWCEFVPFELIDQFENYKKILNLIKGDQHG